MGIKWGKKMNRKKWFYELFFSKDLTVEKVAEKMGIKGDSLYRKIIGRNGFNEKDCKKLIQILDMTFEEIFCKED